MPKKVPEDQPPHVANIHLNGKGDSDCPTLPTAMPRATDSSAITKKQTLEYTAITSMDSVTNPN